MARVLLIHWKPEESATRVEALRAAGHEATVAAPQGSPALRGLTKGVEAVIIDLSRLPLQGRAVAVELRRRVESRHVPIVFAEGVPEKVESVRTLLPDAGYASWDDLPTTLERHLRCAAKSPAVPDTMAGYSGTPLPKKLGIKAGSVVALLGAPDGFEAELTPLPGGVKFVRRAAGADRLLLFAKSMSELKKRWAPAVAGGAEGSTIWVVWPKKSSGIVSSLREQDIRAFGLSAGWVDYKICAVNATLSGLAFAKRKTRSKGSGENPSR
jgi:CheY-like chemotaxis protein